MAAPVLLLALGLAAPAAAADGPAPPAAQPDPAEALSMQSYGIKRPNCIEWTDACRICRRDSAGEPQCSTPGIACLPGPIVCRAERDK